MRLTATRQSLHDVRERQLPWGELPLPKRRPLLDRLFAMGQELTASRHAVKSIHQPFRTNTQRLFLHTHARLSSLIHPRTAFPLPISAIDFLRSAAKQRESLQKKKPSFSIPSGSHLGRRTLKWPPHLLQMRSPPSPPRRRNRANSAKSTLPPSLPHPPQKTSHPPKSAKHGPTSSPAAQVA